MALSYLVDASVLKRMGQPVVRAAVEPLTARGEVARPTICDLEVGYSARSGTEWGQLMGALEVFATMETTAADLRRALQVQHLLAERGQRGRKIPDLLVAAAAEQSNLAVLHYDSDFDLIAAVTGQPTRWVVPAGQAD
ncbi:MAG: PIN domain-containing protein [Mycobacteriales bacterium]